MFFFTCQCSVISGCTALTRAATQARAFTRDAVWLRFIECCQWKKNIFMKATFASPSIDNTYHTKPYNLCTLAPVLTTSDTHTTRYITTVNSSEKKKFCFRNNQNVAVLIQLTNNWIKYHLVGYTRFNTMCECWNTYQIIFTLHSFHWSHLL